MDFHLPTIDKPDKTIAAGDRVRSYDFPGMRDDCYIDGRVTRITDRIDGCARYEVEFERRVVQGVEFNKLPEDPQFIYPPVNGTPSWLGGVTYGVVKIS